MYSSSLIFPCFWLFGILTRASPGRTPFGLDVDKYVCSFLGGAVINVDQVGIAKLPAVRTVSAEWNVPWMRLSSGANLSDPNNRHSMAQWVGILGNACDEQDWTPFLQAGTATEMDEYGATKAYAWVEWFPAAESRISSQNMAVNPGDQILTVVDVYSRTTGHVYMKNLYTGQEYDANVNADSPEEPQFQICLGYGTAQFFQEWTIANDTADLPIFNNVTFVDVGAMDRHGKAFDFSTGTEDYWNMTNIDRQVAISKGIDGKSFVIYSPQGRTFHEAIDDKLHEAEENWSNS